MYHLLLVAVVSEWTHMYKWYYFNILPGHYMYMYMLLIQLSDSTHYKMAHVCRSTSALPHQGTVVYEEGFQVDTHELYNLYFNTIYTVPGAHMLLILQYLI